MAESPSPTSRIQLPSSSLNFLPLGNQSRSDPLELDEADVVWSSSDDLSSRDPFSPPPSPTPSNLLSRAFPPGTIGLSAALAGADEGGIGAGFCGSAPVNISAWSARRGKSEGWKERRGKRTEEGEGEEMVPPHVMVARSYVTSSVFEGAGRTLKGRDLRRVRDAVFRKTGFLD